MTIPPVIFMRGSAIFPVSNPQMTLNAMKRMMRITHNPTVCEMLSPTPLRETMNGMGMTAMRTAWEYVLCSELSMGREKRPLSGMRPADAE
jgi:hypothetical protein